MKNQKNEFINSPDMEIDKDLSSISSESLKWIKNKLKSKMNKNSSSNINNTVIAPEPVFKNQQAKNNSTKTDNSLPKSMLSQHSIKETETISEPRLKENRKLPSVDSKDIPSKEQHASSRRKKRMIKRRPKNKSSEFKFNNDINSQKSEDVLRNIINWYKKEYLNNKHSETLNNVDEQNALSELLQWYSSAQKNEIESKQTDPSNESFNKDLSKLINLFKGSNHFSKLNLKPTNPSYILSEDVLATIIKLFQEKYKDIIRHITEYENKKEPKQTGSNKEWLYKVLTWYKTKLENQKMKGTEIQIGSNKLKDLDTLFSLYQSLGQTLKPNIKKEGVATSDLSEDMIRYIILLYKIEQSRQHGHQSNYLNEKDNWSEQLSPEDLNRILLMLFKNKTERQNQVIFPLYNCLLLK